ncbi:hypothetical protein BC938DRAFT_476093 [Jimgerdemannia flammicorona]|uniref:Uncharacterized protein n=1 Tax=Jimgerdemannia flammicorona TaxID=994334 RepID=A0A433QQW1_9FUNG|nr:hypothetical protein BC938DRAFT_476093 [Jimgerdemannia flammicorona]
MSKSLLQKAEDIATTTGALVLLYLARPETDPQMVQTNGVKHFATPVLQRHHAQFQIADQAANALINTHKEELGREQVTSQLEETKRELERCRERVRTLEREATILRGMGQMPVIGPPGGGGGVGGPLLVRVRSVLIAVSHTCSFLTSTNFGQFTAFTFEIQCTGDIVHNLDERF